MKDGIFPGWVTQWHRTSHTQPVISIGGTPSPLHSSSPTCSLWLLLSSSLAALPIQIWHRAGSVWDSQSLSRWLFVSWPQYPVETVQAGYLMYSEVQSLKTGQHNQLEGEVVTSTLPAKVINCKTSTGRQLEYERALYCWGSIMYIVCRLVLLIWRTIKEKKMFIRRHFQSEGRQCVIIRRGHHNVHASLLSVIISETLSLMMGV